MLRISITLLTLVSVSLVGCGAGDPFALAPVSGTVTIDGLPAANVVVTFTPAANDSTAIVGPFSSAVTDDQGKFTLKSKQGSLGAVVGQHSVSCQHRNYNPEAESNLRSQIQSARGSGKDANKRISELKKALEEAKTQKMIPERYSKISLTVGENGLVDHTFELTSE